MLYLDIQFARMLAHRMDRWKEMSTNPFKANFRCPICGDSEKNKSKRRGWIYQNGGDNYLRYGCFNCNANMSFHKFLKLQDYNLFEQYTLEKYRNNVVHEREEVAPEKTIPKTRKYIPNIFSDLKSISQLPDDHPVRKYINTRCIPEHFYDKIFYAPKFFKWASGNTKKFSYTEGSNDHPRLILPWYSEEGIPFAYSARAFGPEDPKYFRVVVDDSFPTFFGMNRVDLNKRVYVVEGEIDSLFLDNCVAVGTSALYRFSVAKTITYIPDRDIRNPQIMKVVEKLINTGQKVCMLPEAFAKDINDAVKDGMTKEEITKLIDDHSFSGLEAKLYFTKWSKI